MTSPNINTTVVEIIIANVAGIIASKNIGKDSIAKALDNNKVANSKCFLSIIGNILCALSFSSSVPFNRSISNYKGSIEEYPTVKPDIVPANNTIKVEYNINIKN